MKWRGMNEEESARSHILIYIGDRAVIVITLRIESTSFPVYWLKSEDSDTIEII